MSKVVDITDVNVTERTIENAQPPQPPAPIPMKIVPVTITGTLRDGKTVTDKAEMNMPQAETGYVSAMAFLWNQYKLAGTLSFKDSENKFTIYPLHAFDKIELEFASVVGVTL